MQQEAPAPAGQQAAQVLAERKGDSRHKNPGREVLQKKLFIALHRGLNNFVEGKTYLQSYDLAPPPPPPLLSASCLSFSVSLCFLVEFIDGRKGGEGGRGAESYDSKKFGPL
jgi:hypothetical protein